MDWLRRGAAAAGYYAKGLCRRTGEHHIFLWGGGLAYSMIFCIIPFILILFYIAGLLLDTEALRRQLEFFIDAAVPYERQADLVKEVVFSRAQDLIVYRGIYGVLGGVGLLFAASGLFSSMRTVLNTVYKVQIHKSEPVAKLRDFAVVFVVLCFFLVSITFAPLLEAVKDATSLLPQFGLVRLTGLARILYGSLSFWLMFAVFFAFYKGIPYRRMETRVAAVSALSTAILWEIAEQLFGYYINHMPTLRRVYGTYALFVALGFWVYYSSVIFIVGAEIGQLYRERRQGAQGGAPPGP